jgi:two-component system CheB/CheR fusion protein
MDNLNNTEPEKSDINKFLVENRGETEQNALRDIFTRLRVCTGHDFANYKRPTLLRRIERRITAHSLPNLVTYAAYLQHHPDEVNSLLKDLLISVTNFFRDKKAFEALELEIIPAMLKNKKKEDQVRIWVTGCATGEEAYSIAMLCAEQTMNVIDAPKVQIFATDIDEDAIQHAREGFYTINDATDVSTERLRRFFNKEGDGYRIRREIREMVLFANHNFIKDPPFSHLDLISCRNVLIYLNRLAQERVMETFHFALNTGGFLFLGTSESVNAANNLYDIVSREHPIFKSRQATMRAYPVPESVPAIRIDRLQTGPAGKEKPNPLRWNPSPMAVCTFASNEELQAMNEELRSAAEELETSKEELQSMNEELRTVNQELKVKIEETSLTSNNLQNLINSANIGTIFLDPSLRIAMFTPAVRGIFNLIPADYGRQLSDITHRLQYHNLLEDAENVLQKSSVIEREVSTTDGRIYIMRILPYRTAENRINGVVITFIDISSRKQAEEALRQSKERMEKAFSIGTVGIIYFKISGEITGANDAFLQMCGYSREEVNMGRLRWDEMTPEEFMPQSRKKIEEYMLTGRITPYEKQYIRKDGTRWWALFAATRISEEEGVEFIIDITARKLLEQQKDGFIAIASHELKTPVTSIKVYVEVLRERLEKSKDSENIELVKKLNTQVERLNNLIVDLLDTTNIVEGQLTLKLKVFDINELISEQVEEAKRLSKDHVFIVKPGNPKNINADRDRIGQVLTNLLSNAVKYSAPGSKIIITSRNTPNGIKVSVQDNGIGIPENMINSVFDRFFRISNTQTETYPGMGLGLYISAEIIERHGGTISVESVEGEGSTFYFTLPGNSQQAL